MDPAPPPPAFPRIPRILHQTWKHADLPPHYRRWSESFRRHLSGWEFRFWGDDDCLALVRESYPQHLEAYQKLRNPAERSDFFRYLVLHRHGGMYADIDCECRRPLEFLRETDEFVVATELETRSARVMELYRSDLPRLFCQWTFLSRPGHPILERLIPIVAANADRQFSPDPIINVLKRTGPHVFTEAVLAHLAQPDPGVRILPPAFFGASESRTMLRFAFSFFFPEFGRKVYVRHHFEMSWMDAKAKREMVIRNLMPSRARKTASGAP